MKKIRQWLNDRRDRRLREELNRRGYDVTECSLRYEFVKYGKSDDKLYRAAEKLRVLHQLERKEFDAICAQIDELV